MLSQIWKNTLLDHFKYLIDLSPIAIGGLLLKNNNVYELENWTEEKAIHAVNKIPTTKYHQFLRHVIIEISTGFAEKDKGKYTFRNILSYDDDKKDMDTQIFSYMDGVDQPLPIYPKVKEHVRLVNKFLERRFIEILKSAYPNDFSMAITYPRGGQKEYHYYINGDVFLDIVPYSWSDIRYNIGTDFVVERPSLNLLHDYRHSFHILVLYNTYSSITFLLASRREVLKDFNMMGGCVCTPLDRYSRVFRRKKFNVNEFSAMVTVFNPDKAVKRLKYYPIIEEETPHILRVVKHYKNIQYLGEKNAIK